MIGTGLEYIQHNEQLTITSSETANISTLNSEAIPLEFASREGFLTTTTFEKYQTRHRLINVPLTFSWLLQTKNLTLAPSAGIVVNIGQISTGYTLLGPDTTAEVIFNPRVGLGYRLGGKIFYQMNNRTSLFAFPQFEYNPSNIVYTSERNSITQRRNFAKVDVGISIRIGN